MSTYYPVFLDLRHRPVVVVGGSEVAERRVLRLLEAGAAVTLIAAEVTPELGRLAAQEALIHVPRSYRPGDLAGARLAIAERLDAATNRAIFAEADELGIFVNVEDDTPCCSFIAPAVVRRGDLAVAVSTSGRAPALAVRLRQRLEQELGPEYGEFLELAHRLRQPLLAEVPDFAERRHRWYRLVDSEILSLLRSARKTEAQRLAEEIMGVPPEPVPAQPGGAHPHQASSEVTRR